MGDMHSGFTGMDAIQKGFLEVQTKFLAGKKPLVFVRGNHEVRGIANGLYDTFLGHPSGKSHFLMRYGDVAFMIVDTGDPQFDLFETGKKFRLEQAKWISTSLKDPLFADAAFKVLLCHIPPTDNKKIDAMFKKGLGKAVPDLFLSGHVHRPQFFKAGEKTPFPLCIGYGALVLKSTAQEIELVSINWQGETAGQWNFPKRRKGK
jgi:3',5'-cyclic AMP phosphodiesterase CpdA